MTRKLGVNTVLGKCRHRQDDIKILKKIGMKMGNRTGTSGGHL
jgi:hypothetical protein